jgi:hypothetical protein
MCSDSSQEAEKGSTQIWILELGFRLEKTLFNCDREGWSAVPFWEWWLSGGIPLPLPIFGIIGLAKNRRKIYGAQSVAGKILSRKDLGPAKHCCPERFRLVHDLLFVGLCARSDVTRNTCGNLPGGNRRVGAHSSTRKARFEGYCVNRSR